VTRIVPREGATVDEVLQEVLAARAGGNDIKELFGGPRDWIDAMVPTVVFVLGNAFFSLRAAAIAAGGAMAVIVVIRLARRETLRHAFSGVVGVAVAGLFALKTHKAKNFFLPGIIINAVYAVVFFASVAFGRPIVGLILRMFSDKPASWHEHPAVRRAYVEVTLLWGLTFALRVVVQETLRRLDLVGWLAVTKIAMGYPLYLGALALTLPYVKRRTASVPVPEVAEPAAEAEAEGGGEDAEADAP
jgi:intracellular septation protein A